MPKRLNEGKRHKYKHKFRPNFFINRSKRKKNIANNTRQLQTTALPDVHNENNGYRRIHFV